MKILGNILVLLYAGLMLFAICKEKSKSISSLLISLGCLSALAYTLLNIVWNRNFIAVLITGMICISAGALINGIRQKNVHIRHHIVRFIIEAIITAICWSGA